MAISSFRVANGGLLIALTLVTGCSTTKQGERDAAMFSPAPQAPGCIVELRADVPFEVVGGRISVLAEANGQPVRMLVDTGTSGVAQFDPSLAAKLQLLMEAPTVVEAFSGSVDANVARLDSLSIGDADASDVSAIIAPIKVIGGFEGIIGLGFLSHYDVEIDPNIRRLRLYEVRGCGDTVVPFEEAYDELPLRRGNGGTALAPIKVNGEGLLALVDTGSNVTLLSTRGAAQAGLREAALAVSPAIEATDTTGASIDAKMVQIDRFEIASYLFTNIDIAILSTDLSYDAFIGVDFILGRRSWLSFATDALFMSKGISRRDAT